MRKLLLVLGFLTAGLSTLAQTLPCRYWFDQNDGEAQQAVVVDGALQLPAGLPEGFHVVYMQLGGDSMSSVRSHLFYTPILTSTWSESVQYTYWFDRDFANRQEGMLGENPLTFPTDGLAEGFHVVYLRLGSGQEATLRNYLFYKETSTEEWTTPVPFAYWFDHDADNVRQGVLSDSPMLFDANALAEGEHSVDILIGSGAEATVRSFTFYRTPSAVHVYDTVCGQRTWRSTTYTASTTIDGGDTVLHLTILPTYLHADTVVAVERYQWHDSLYTASTTDTLRLTTADGCDSNAVLHLALTGWPDNVADADCKTAVVANDFDMTLLFHCDSAHSMGTPLVADLDGDGLPEIVAASAFPNPANDCDAMHSMGFNIYSGQDGGLISKVATPRYPIHGQSWAIADVDADRHAEIFLLCSNGHIYCYNHDGTLRYTTQDSVDHRYILQVADLNNDGIAEIVCGPYIFRADNGTLLLHGTMDASGMGMGAPHGVYECVGNEYYLCALGDMDGDGTLELCAGGCIYKIDINNPSGTEGNTWSVLRQVDNHIAGTAVANLDGQTVLLDFDGDGDLDVCVVGISHALNFGTTLHYITPYVWDGQTSEVIAAAGIAVRHQFGASIPYCGDLGGDGKPELTFAITGTSAAGGGMYSFCYNPGSYLNMQLVHRHIPFAETAGFTVFDFNQDGKDELVYRGTTQLYIVDGTSLANLTTPLANHSGTVAEYPVVADANADGHAEILVANAYTAYSTPASAMGRVSVYGSATPGAWSSARKVWNQWAYNSVCINEDMTVPRYRFDLGTTFPGGKRPFNAFLKQMPYMDRDGNLFTPLPDAVATEAWAVSAADGVQLVLGYCNTGDALLASHRVEVYLNEVSDNSLYALEDVPPLPADSCTTFRFHMPRSLVDSVSSSDSLVLAIATRQQDCNPTNNAIAIGHLPLLAHGDSVTAYTGEPIDIDPSLNDSNACDYPTYTIVTAPRHGNAFVGSGSNEGAGGGGGLDELDSPSASPTVGYVSVREGMGEWGEEPHWYYGEDSLRIAIRCNDTVFDTSWIYIHVKPKPEVLTVCDSLRWRDSLYTASGTYTDGDYELNLTVNPSYHSVDCISVTDSCLWQGNAYYASTRDTLRLLTAAGCDSIHTLALTVTGWPDNVHDPDCTTEVDTNVFDMVEKFSCAGVSCLSTPLVADLDGDGLPEIIGLASVDQAIMERYFARNLLVFDGRNGSLKYTIATPLISVCGQGVAIADVDGDGKAEIFVRAQEANNGGRVYCYDHDGSGRWISAEAVDDNYLLTPVDIMGDGHTQLVCGPYIFNASDGTLLLHGTFQVGGTGFGAPHNNGNINGTYAGINNALPYYMYAMGDLDHDGLLELCAGKYVYRITLTNYAGLSGNTWAVYNTATTADILEPDGQTFLADFDGDGTLDICVLGIPTTMHYNTWQECTKWKNGKCISYRTVVDKTDSYNLSVYAWNAVTGEVIAYNNKSVSQVAGPAIPFCGDLDGDGLPEILTETDEGTYIYYFDTASSGSMAFTQITSMSGTPGYTAFDFNQDGRYEVVWRGMSDLAIMDGQKIKQNTPPFNVGTSLVAYSGTIAEYPVVADVDGDGHAELLVSRGYWAWTPNNHHDYGCISVYTSATLGAWNSARKVWNNWAFDNALINEDLSIPQHPFNTATRFPNGRQPMNGFRLPVPNIDRDGNLYNPAADLELVQVEEVQMEDDSIRLRLQLRNNGDATLLAPFGISVYGHSYHGPLLMVDSLSAALCPDSSVTCNLSVPLATLCPLNEGDSLLIAVNDKGLGIAQHGGQQGECDTSNNTAVIPTPAFHSSSDTTAVVCDSLAWYGNVYTQSGDFTRSLTNATGCDSTVTLHLTVGTSYSDTLVATIMTSDSILFEGRHYRLAGTYTDTLHTAAGCDSLHTLSLRVSTRICPEVTNTGTDFWVGYLYNYPELEFGVFEPTILHFLEATSEENADLIVTNPLTGWSTTAHIAAGGSVILTIPNNITSSTANFSPQPHGIHVTSSAPVTLYATNWMLGSTDITAILPTEALRWHYIIQDYPGQRGAQAAILAVEDSTLITITPPVGVSGCALSQPISVMLMAGQKYTLWHGSLSFTGVDVRSDGKPFALFQGNRSAQVPQGVKYADHLYEQAIPVDAWGRDHVIVPTPLRTGGDRIKVTSADDNCLVLLDGDTLVTLGRGQTHEFHMPSGPAHRLVSSRPVSVVQFLTGIKKDGTRGDPSQVQIAPIEQGLCRVSFVVFNPPFTLSLYRQYINIVTTLSDLDSLMLDGNPIGQQFTPLDSLYCYAKISVTPGPHTLVSGTGTFTATIYGLRDSESHAYCAGMALANLRNQLLVDGQEASRYPDGYRACPGDTLHLATAAASGSTNTRWLVDGIEQACGQAPAFDLPCTAPGLHHIAALMHFSADTLRWDDTLRIDIIVGDTSSSVVQADICHGESFGWHDSLYTQPVTALFRTLNAAGCDSTVALHLAVHPTYSDTLAVTVCDNQRYTFEAADYTAAGIYTAALHTAAGCDSLRTLRLDVLPTSSGDTTAVVCDSFSWHGEQYTASTDVPTHRLTNVNGCDSTVTLHLTVNHSNEAVEALTVCNSLVWHGTEYTASTSAPAFTSVNAEGCDSVTTLHLTVNHCSTTEITTCDSYQWNGTTYTASGTYTVGTDTLLLTVLHSTAADTTAVVCDSFSWHGVQYTASTDTPTFLLTNAAGCDSTVTLHLTVNHSTTADTLATVCDSFSWHGVQYTASTDTPTHLLTNAVGCDSTVTLRLTVNHSSAGIDAVTACGSFVWQGVEYTESTTAPTHTSVNAEGCDSVTTLHLTVHPSYAYSVRDTVVENALPHAFGGAQFVQDVADTLFSFATVEGCDSLVSYSLHVFWNAASTLDSALCNLSLPLVWNGVVFDTSVSTKTTLVRSATFTAQGGADSVVVMRLTVHPLYDHHHYASLCDNQVYDWGGHQVWDTGDLGSRRNGSDTLLHRTDSLLSAFGCDSVSSLHLTVHPTYDHHLADTLCTSQPYAWGIPQRQVLEPYSVARSLHGRDSLAAQASAAVDTSFADQLVSVFGCDSVSSLHLHLLPSYRLTFADTICADTFYRFAGQEYSATGSYPQSLSTADGCDSIRTLALKVYPVYDIHVYDTICDGDLYHFEQSAYDTTGVYPHLLQTGSGCDSLRTLHLQRNWRSYNDSSVCQNAQPLVWNGVVFRQEQGQRLQGYYYLADSVHLAGRAQTDSLVVMRVRILDTSATYDVRHACDSLTWHDGVTYTASTADPYIVRPNRWQCDSVCHLVLTLDSTHRFVDRRVVCDSLRWLDGTAYLADTLGPQVTLLTASGCDSVVTLSLAVRYSTEVRLDDTICAMQDYDWHGRHFEHLDVNSYTREHIAMTDSLATAEGCDSTVTMHLVKMALPSFGYSVEHDCVSGNVDVTASALYELDDEDYPLMMPYLRWRSEPHDPLIDGQQGMAAITVHPESETDYVLYAAYTAAGLCRDSMHLRLSPVRVPEAEIRVLPMALTVSQLDYTAYDVSTHDYQERVWRVDGVVQAEVSRTLTGTASPTADTVRIELELYNGQCRDTALALVPVQTVALFAPDIFTPGRESNNRFFIGGQGILDGELYVYNRDGLLVYRTADFRTGWDGRRADGTLCPQAAYVWKFVYHAVSQPDAARVEVGTVTLVH